MDAQAPMALRKTRSSLTSGRRKHLAPADGRSAPARRRNDIVAELLSAFATPTDMQRSLAERVASLRVSLEIQDSYMLAGDSRFKPALHARVSGAYLRALRELHGKDVHAPRKRADQPTTLEELAKLEGWTLPKAGENAFGEPLHHASRFRDAVLDADDDLARRFRANDDQPDLGRHRKRDAARDAALAKLARAPRSRIVRRKIKGAKP